MLKFLLTIGLIYIISSIFIIIWLDAQRKQTIQRNNYTKELNEKLEKEWNLINLNIEKATDKLNETNHNIEQAELVYTHLKDAYDTFQSALDERKKNAIQDASEEVRAHNEDINQIIQTIMTSYNNKMKAIEEELSDKKKRILAYVEDLKRKQEIEKDKSFYTLEISSIDLEDITKLLQLSNTLHHPDVLRKLVYKTFFEKRMNELLGRVAGTKAEQSAVYKITHIDSGMCYIGQTTNIKERWRKHLKCGLGIETPATNSFYQGMIKHGVWNFTWEVIEFCPKEKLNEIEKYWIDFYQTNIWGWNSKGGNAK